jgi:hypothetical protein
MTISGDPYIALRRETDGKVFSLDRNGLQSGLATWSPHEKHLAIVFAMVEPPPRSDANLWTLKVDPVRVFPPQSHNAGHSGPIL